MYKEQEKSNIILKDNFLEDLTAKYGGNCSLKIFSPNRELKILKFKQSNI